MTGPGQGPATLESVAASAPVAEPRPAVQARATGVALPVVVLTTFFPSPRDPHRTPFLRNLVGALSAEAAVELVIPVPRRPPIGAWRERTPVPAVERHEGFALAHPRYLAVPGLHALSGLTYFLGVRRVLRRLLDERGPFVLHAHCAYPDAVGAALAARALRLPLVVTVHGSDINVEARHALQRPQIRWALRAARRVVTVSGALQRQVAALTGLPERAIDCIPCAGFAPAVFRPRADAERAALRASLAISPGCSSQAVFVGHLAPVKGLDILLRAWALAATGATSATRRLVLIGEGPERPELERLAARLGIAGSVAFMGPLPQATVADWIAASDVLCLSSHSEGSPNVVVEALASGVPVVASRVGGIPDLVRDGANGRLVPPGDPRALADALVEVLGRRWNPVEVSASIAHLTWQALARRNRDLLAEVAAEVRRPCMA